ncbi:MAG: hypothetical protein O9293_01050 [Porphyrobacter sp.]|nr:hypothetical protein [Porphyrobacter sp.]
MEIVFLAVALVPALALLVVPQTWLKPLMAASFGVFLLCVLWTASFANSCSSDGCIGIFILGAFTALVGVASAIAGGIRWAIIALRRDQDLPEE